MRIKFNPYRKRDGSLMLYANNDRRVSIGITAENGIPAPYGNRTSAGQRKLIESIHTALENAEEWPLEGAPDFDVHDEEKVRLSVGDLYLTDIATIGGVRTGSDGFFLVTKSGKIINLSQWITV